jgi:hypothetical protein
MSVGVKVCWCQGCAERWKVKDNMQLEHVDMGAAAKFETAKQSCKTELGVNEAGHVTGNVLGQVTMLHLHVALAT